MNSYDEDLSGQARPSSPERVLALSVIALAVNDARTGSDGLRQRAVNWLLANDAGVGFWCRLGEVDVAALREMVRRECGAEHQAPLL